MIKGCRDSSEREQRNSGRVEEIGGVAVSEGRIQEGWINEINAEEDSGEEAGDRQRRKAAGERGRRDGKRQLGAGGGAHRQRKR